MPNQVFDTFTVGADELMTVHVPDTGTGYTEVLLTGTVRLRAGATTDFCEPNGADVTANAYTAQPNPTVAEYDVSAIIRGHSTGAVDQGMGLFARRTDNDNVYGLQMSGDGTAAAANTIFKRVAGVNTQLGSEDTAWVNGDVVLFEIRDATKKSIVNGATRISTTDNALTAAGGWGLGGGAFPVWPDLSKVKATPWALDDFTCTEVAGAGSVFRVLTLMGAGV